MWLGTLLGSGRGQLALLLHSYTLPLMRFDSFLCIIDERSSGNIENRIVITKSTTSILCTLGGTPTRQA